MDLMTSINIVLKSETKIETSVLFWNNFLVLMQMYTSVLELRNDNIVNVWWDCSG